MNIGRVIWASGSREPEPLSGTKIVFNMSVRTANIISLVVRLAIEHQFWTFPVSTSSAHCRDIIAHTWNLPKQTKIGIWAESDWEALEKAYQSLGLLPEKMTLVMI